MRTAVAALLLVGCGGYRGEGGIALAIEAPGAALVVLQDGDQPFQPVQLDGQSSALVSVTDGAYAVGVFCQATSFSRRASFVFDTEPGVVFSSCETNVITSVTITGMTAPGAEVWAGQSAPAVADATGAYEVSVREGPVELVALVPGEPPRMLLRRIEATADKVVDLPVVTDGVDLIPVTPTVTNPSGEPVFLSSDMNTAATFVQFAFDEAATVHVPPPSILEDTDRVTIGAGAGKCNVQLPASVLAPILNIPSAFTATIDRAQAQWTADTTVAWQLNTLRLARRSTPGSTGGSPTITYNVRPSWREVQGAGDVIRIIDVATEIPGWRSELAGFDAGDQLDVLVRVGRGNFDGELAGCTERTSLVW